jgi:DNA mismatch repair ATPase MutS
MNAQVLNQRQDAIHQFYQDCNAEKVRELRDVLSGLKSLHCLLKRMEHANPTVADWKNLYSVGGLHRGGLIEWASVSLLAV